jgi:hypothetical protein
MSTETQPQYPNLDQSRVEAAKAASHMLAARTPLTSGSVSPAEVIVLADWLLATDGLGADPVEAVDRLAYLTAAVIDAYISPDPDASEEGARARLAKMAQSCEGWLYARNVAVPDWQHRARLGQAETAVAP